MASRPSERTEPLIVGEVVRDEVGHWYRVLEQVRHGVYRVDALQELNGTYYSYGYKPVLAYRSDLRKDGE